MDILVNKAINDWEHKDETWILPEDDEEGFIETKPDGANVLTTQGVDIELSPPILQAGQKWIRNDFYTLSYDGTDFLLTAKGGAAAIITARHSDGNEDGGDGEYYH